MINWKQICSSINNATQSRFELVTTSPLSGGCTNSAWKLHGQKDKHYFVKLNSADKDEMFAAEAAGLQALAKTNTIRVPRVICTGITDQHTYLVLEYLELHQHGVINLFGKQLADLHRIQVEQFGWVQDNTLALTAQYNPWTSDWLSFWREHRLGFQLELAEKNGFRGRIQELGRKVIDSLPYLFADHHPAASMLHGDLWGGNYAFLQDGTPVIFDPAPYYGDREADIAMTELFGGFGAEFYASYETAYPLDTGYKTRKYLYNLYHILNHCNLFGRSYLAQAESMMRHILSK